MYFFNVEGILVEFMLQDQLLQIVESLFVYSLMDKREIFITEKFILIPLNSTNLDK